MGYDRYTFRSNVSAKLNRYLTTDVMVSGRYGMRDFPGGDGFIWMYKGTIISHPNERPYINDDPAYPANIYNQENSGGDVTEKGMQGIRWTRTNRFSRLFR